MSTLIPQRKYQSLDDRLIPLINVVFLLLIFFLIAGQVSSQQNHSINPPRSHSEKMSESSKWRIEMDIEGSVTLNGKAINLSQLSVILASRLSSQPLSIALKMDRKLKAEHLDHLLSVLRASGQTRVTLLTEAQPTVEGK